MGRRHKNEFEDSLAMNMFTWRQYFDRLRELSMTMFEWTNLPKTVDERFLEKTLFERGNCIFFFDEDLDMPDSEDKALISHYNQQITENLMYIMCHRKDVLMRQMAIRNSSIILTLLLSTIIT